MEVLKKVALVLVIIGALNWGLIGIFQWDLVGAILGGIPVLLRIVYTLVGLSGVLMISGGLAKPEK
ncbi:MAG: hypothetical protein CEN89_13 [Candidatus Berkelbacteria bacterium Licking1014_7]|uniref:DUF378 domain-containing protein n=1 Tax=Candidatus Berkelbacteria bacterium Licking1014_7 TaxID=2017147 RepID=A0A554LKS7_9BACT|nr:MAG: hypothetical protein CEN89_13 [Candidatus Berkelbacteria bacterium Licking1014_7]